MSKTASIKSLTTALGDACAAEGLAMNLGTNFLATVNDRGWVDIRVNPANAIGDPTKFDFIRIATEDENYYRVIHLTHNEVLCGEVRLTGSMAGMLTAIVTDLCETLF